MNLEIEGRHKNTLLQREEIQFEVLDSKTTPTRKEIRTKLAAQLGAKEELLIIDEIDHEFGSTVVTGFAKLYENMEALQQLEAEHMVRKQTGEKKVKAEKKK